MNDGRSEYQETGADLETGQFRRSNVYVEADSPPFEMEPDDSAVREEILVFANGKDGLSSKIPQGFGLMPALF